MKELLFITCWFTTHSLKKCCFTVIPSFSVVSNEPTKALSKQGFCPVILPKNGHLKSSK